MHFGGNRQWMFPMTLNSGFPTWAVPAMIKFPRGIATLSTLSILIASLAEHSLKPLTSGVRKADNLGSDLPSASAASNVL